jgi:hypothetical protein
MDPRFFQAQIAQAMQNRPKQPFVPMWVEDQQRALTPGFKDGYDYYNALKYGVQREGKMGGHMYSRVPQTGLLLKDIQHPTFWKTLAAEKAAGYEVYVKDGRVYSRPRTK